MGMRLGNLDPLLGIPFFLALLFLLGLLLCFIQYKWGVVSLPGNFVVSYYPVVVKFSDVLLALLSVAAIGLIMAYLPTRSIKDKTHRSA